MAMPDFDQEILKFVQEQWTKGKVTKEAEATQAKAKKDKNVALGKTVVKGLATTAATSGLGTVLTAVAPSTVVSLGSTAAKVAVSASTIGVHVPTTFNPITWAAKPWLAAKDVAQIAFSLERVYAVMQEDGGIYTRKYLCEEWYTCSCSSRRRQAFVVWNKNKLVEYGTGARDASHKDCKAVRDFLVAQKEAKAARIAVNSTVVGVPFYMLYSAARSIYKRANGTIHQDRAVNAQHLVRDAMPVMVLKDEKTAEIAERGCRRAQALIALMLGELDLKTPNANVANYPRTMAAMIHPDGWDGVSGALSAAIITDAGNGKALPRLASSGSGPR